MREERKKSEFGHLCGAFFIYGSQYRKLHSRLTTSQAVRSLPFAAGTGQKGRHFEKKGREHKVGEACDIHISGPRPLREKRLSLAESP